MKRGKLEIREYIIGNNVGSYLNSISNIKEALKIVTKGDKAKGVDNIGS
jgi:hypothetical protein